MPGTPLYGSNQKIISCLIEYGSGCPKILFFSKYQSLSFLLKDSLYMESQKSFRKLHFHGNYNLFCKCGDCPAPTLRPHILPYLYSFISRSYTLHLLEVQEVISWCYILFENALHCYALRQGRDTILFQWNAIVLRFSFQNFCLHIIVEIYVYEGLNCIS